MSSLLPAMAEQAPVAPKLLGKRKRIDEAEQGIGSSENINVSSDKGTSLISAAGSSF